jgi:hypothetical protein
VIAASLGGANRAAHEGTVVTVVDAPDWERFEALIGNELVG